MAKDLKLGFLDIVSFNVYPLWPPEVVALGFDHYIEQVRQPIAANKPLLITEFGANSLEAKEDGEARLLRECWRGLQKAGACGGVVFEFADEWWKNYDNPRRAGNWWDRKPAPDDDGWPVDPCHFHLFVTVAGRGSLAVGCTKGADSVAASPKRGLN